jgi:hypothetical protein
MELWLSGTSGGDLLFFGGDIIVFLGIIEKTEE